MEKIKPRTLSGFMELLPAAQEQMEQIMQILRETYALYGFYPLDTPVLESAEVLLAKGGGETEKQIYRFQKGDSDLAMRFDLTVPLAKYVALNYGQLTFPFRRYQIGKVYRGERAQRGRFREFYQADIDIIGDGQLDIINEAEIPSIIYKTFTKLGLDRFQIRINNRKILSGFFAMLGLHEQAGDVMRTIDKLEKIGADKVREILIEDCKTSAEQADEILKFITLSGGTQGILEALQQYRGRNELLDCGIEELTTVAAYMEGFGVPADHFEIDLTIARGLDYYTGTVYETTMLDHPEIGSICSGGRYDNLAEYYTDKKLPGVGISIGLTRLFFILQDKGYLNQDPPAAPADVLILPMTQDVGAAIALATRLRDAGVRVQLHCEKKKFKAKIAYADKLAIPYVIFMGEDEIQNNVIALKELATGEQTNTDFEQALARIREGLGERASKTVIKNIQ
ncbi:MAG: histidine--tRNA ligase [Butyricicoccus pullicaecorum]|nr:histidine--tRNA ligase [Butyricicoccus pullicaecorum]